MISSLFTSRNDSTTYKRLARYTHAALPLSPQPTLSRECNFTDDRYWSVRCCGAAKRTKFVETAWEVRFVARPLLDDETLRRGGSVRSVRNFCGMTCVPKGCNMTCVFKAISSIEISSPFGKKEKMNRKNHSHGTFEKGPVDVHRPCSIYQPKPPKPSNPVRLLAGFMPGPNKRRDNWFQSSVASVGESNTAVNLSRCDRRGKRTRLLHDDVPFGT